MSSGTGASSGSHLFTVRVWLDEPAEGHIGWRGKVQHVLSGETRYFRDWPALLAFLSKTLALDGEAQGREAP